MLVGFEHIGMAVSDLDRSIHFYCDLLGMTLVLRKRAPKGGAELGFVSTGNGQLELICPDEKVTPARDIPDTQAGVRHITFAFTDIEAVYEKLMAAGVPSVQKPRDAFNTEIVARVAFVRDPDGIMVELAQH